MLTLQADEYGISLVELVDGGVVHVGTVPWETIAVHIKKHLEEQETNNE